MSNIHAVKATTKDGRALRYRHRRPELLRAVADYVLARGVSNLSLRRVAAAVGVSHAALIGHFSSKDAMIVEALERIAADVVASVDDFEAVSMPTVEGMLWAIWRFQSDPPQLNHFRVFLEMASSSKYSRCALVFSGGGETSVQVMANVWLSPVETRLVRDGWGASDAAATATTVVAQLRGLQLDLIMTGDRKRVEEAFALVVHFVTERNRRMPRMSDAHAHPSSQGATPTEST